MAVYFKIQMQYKRTHAGKIIETTGGRKVARLFLERCLVAKKGPAPSRVVKDGSFTFTSTEFPLNQKCYVRLCEATSPDSTFVRGVLMVLHGNSTHLRSYATLLADKIYSRRCINDLVSQLRDEGQTLNRNTLQDKLEDEETRCAALEEKLRCLNRGKLGLAEVSSKASSSVVHQNHPEIDEDEYCAMIFLSSKHAATEPRKERLSSPAPTDRIVRLFEDRLLSRHPTQDSWEETGSAYFRTTLNYFLARGIPIQFCLPAFPCKSTNPRKTSGTAPDGAEHEAFYNIHHFCLELQKIYPPGADFVVVSDGHVFSDCIGTDDCDVYKYTDAVKKLSGDVHNRLSARGKSPVAFVNLHDVFHDHGVLLDSSFKIDWTDHDIYRPVQTQINPKDENCRKMMLRSCGFDTGMLEKAIKDDQNHSLTKVYQGFSRFMKDDLEDHPDFQDQNPSKRGVLATAVAKEMLKRNQAYSHLVELLHPRAIRLSIHQHKNHGPKFAINTLHKDSFKPIKKMEDIYSIDDAAEYAKVEEAHIPTPWHNVLMEVEGHAMTYICKNGIVEDEKNKVDSRFECIFKESERGARWYVKERVRK